MDTTEYLAFVPLLIYGIALAELLKEWKRLFDPSKIYLPYFLLTVTMTEVGVYNVFIYQSVLNNIGHSFTNYLLILLPPFTFYLAIHAFTPDEGEETSDYFKKNIRTFSLMIAAFISTNFVFSFEQEFSGSLYIYLAAILVLVSMAITRKPWLAYLMIVLAAIPFFIDMS